MQGSVRSTIGDPDLRSPCGFDFGLRPPLRMTRRGGSGVPGSVRSTFGDPDLRSPSGFDSGLSPSAQDDTVERVWQRKLKFTLVFRRFLGLEFALEFQRNFFSFKLIKKPSPVGEGGPRQWWMRSPQERLTQSPTPHPSACGCHLLPLEKAFVYSCVVC